MLAFVYCLRYGKNFTETIQNLLKIVEIKNKYKDVTKSVGKINNIHM